MAATFASYSAYWLLLMNYIQFNMPSLAQIEQRFEFNLAVLGECPPVSISAVHPANRSGMTMGPVVKSGLNSLTLSSSSSSTESFILTWRSNLYTDERCCWSVLNITFSDQLTEEVHSVCNCDDNPVASAHECNDDIWICTLPPQEESSSSGTTASLATQYSYMFTDGQLTSIDEETSCSNVSSAAPRAPVEFPCYIEQAATNSTTFTTVPRMEPTPSSITPEVSPVLIPTSNTPNVNASTVLTPSITIIPQVMLIVLTPSSTIPEASTVAVVHTPLSITPGDSVCVEDGIWRQTAIETNVTVDGACYNGSATGIRRCGNNGIWDDPLCIVPMEFIEVLSQIKESNEEGLDRLLELIMSDENDIAPELYLFLLETLVETQQAQDEFVSDEFTEKVLRVVVELIKILQTAINSTERQRLLAARLLLVLDSFALTLVKPSNNTHQIQTISLSVLEFSDAILNQDAFSAIRSGQNLISLPTNIFNSSFAARIASFVYQNISDLLPPRDANSSIVSPIISSTTNCETCSVDNLTNNVTIQLKLEVLPNVNDNVSCVFFHFQFPNAAGDWSSSGCTTTSVDGDIVTCSCNHLTHFAILLSPGVESPAHFEVLNTIGLVLVPISLLCMVLVILTYACIRSLWSIRNYIHIMLCVSLFMAQLVFIIGIDKIKNEGACSAVAVLLQYLFLVTFMWMLMEGVVLYVSLVRVFIKNHIYYIIGFTVTSYVVPAVYLIIVVPIGFLVKVDDIRGSSHYLYYVNDDLVACWLNNSSGFIAVFIVPVCLIILVNVGFFIMAIVIMRKHFEKEDQKSLAKKVNYWLRSSICLTLLMGITWILGLLAFSDELIYIAYIYTIFIAGQGVLLFILLVPLSKQVRDAYLRCFKRRVPYAETVLQFFSSISSGKETITKTDKNDSNHKKSGGITLGSFGGENGTLEKKPDS